MLTAAENDRMSSVLRKLHAEVFILNTREPLARQPEPP